MELTVDGRKAKAKGATVGDLVASLGLNGEEVLVKVNGKLAANGTEVSAKDTVKIMRVIFGG